jgi:hypothetical protein
VDHLAQDPRVQVAWRAGVYEAKRAAKWVTGFGPKGYWTMVGHTKRRIKQDNLDYDAKSGGWYVDYNYTHEHCVQFCVQSALHWSGKIVPSVGAVGKEVLDVAGGLVSGEPNWLYSASQPVDYKANFDGMDYGAEIAQNASCGPGPKTPEDKLDRIYEKCREKCRQEYPAEGEPWPPSPLHGARYAIPQYWIGRGLGAYPASGSDNYTEYLTQEEHEKLK